MRPHNRRSDCINKPAVVSAIVQRLEANRAARLRNNPGTRAFHCTPASIATEHEREVLSIYAAAGAGTTP